MFENDNKNRIVNVTKQIEGANNQFENLEDRVRKLSTVAVYIGNQLENKHSKRKKAVEISQLMKYLTAFEDMCSDDEVNITSNR